MTASKRSESRRLGAQADEHWAALGHPEELRAMSSWPEGAPGEAYDPHGTVVRTIAALDAEIG